MPNNDVEPNDVPAMLEALIAHHGTATAMVDTYRTEHPFNEKERRRLLVNLTRARREEAKLDVDFERWARRTRLQLVEWGTLHVGQSGPPWFDDVYSIAVDEGNWSRALRLANELDAQAKNSKDDKEDISSEYIRLSGLRGLCYFYLAEELKKKNEYLEAYKQYGHARDAYDETCDRAIRGAIYLYSQYRTNYLNAAREVSASERQLGKLNDADYEQRLRDILEAQWELIDALGVSDNDAYLGLKHAMRISAILKDEKKFADAFDEATTDGFLGKTQEDLESEIYAWIKNDRSGDFVNVRDFETAFANALNRPHWPQSGEMK